MADTSVYTVAQLASIKASNDDYLSNKFMYRELNKIKMLVLGNNLLYGPGSNYTVYTYTSVADKDYFALLLRKLQLMFPDCFIYYTRNSNSQTLSVNSLRYISASDTYTASTVSITNTLFISQTEMTIPIPIEQLVFSYNYNGTGDINSLALENIPLIFVSGLFELVDKSKTINGTLVTVTVNTKYFSTSYNSASNFGLTFNGNTFFTNINVTNINIIILTNIPLSNAGSQFINLKSLSISVGQNPVIRPNTLLNYCFSNCTNFNSDISDWNTLNVTKMIGIFKYATNFNKNISKWNTSNVTDMSSLFFGATNFNNGDSLLGLNWSTNKVTKISSMFSSAKAFNQYIGDWNTENVQYISSIFFNASKFNNGDVIGGTSKPMNWNFNNLFSYITWREGSALTQENAPSSLPW